MAPERFKFWMVYGFDQGAPIVRHHTKSDAQREAQRLAALHPDVTFVVLAAVDAYVAEAPEVQRVRILKDEIPF